MSENRITDHVEAIIYLLLWCLNFFFSSRGIDLKLYYRFCLGSRFIAQWPQLFAYNDIKLQANI